MVTTIAFYATIKPLKTSQDSCLPKGERKVRAGNSNGSWETQPGVSPETVQQKAYRQRPQGAGKGQNVR